jgi:hypothetical protein
MKHPEEQNGPHPVVVKKKEKTLTGGRDHREIH